MRIVQRIGRNSWRVVRDDERDRLVRERNEARAELAKEWFVTVRSGGSPSIHTEHVGPFTEYEARLYAKACAQERHVLAECHRLVRPLPES